MEFLINPFEEQYCLSYFVSKQTFLNNIQILFGGYYNYFKSAFIVDLHPLLLHKEHNIKSITIYPTTNHFYSNLRLIIGKYYYLTLNNFHKFIINNIEINIYNKIETFDNLIKKHSILHNNVLTLYPTHYYQLQTNDYFLSPNINKAKLLYAKMIKKEINEEFIKSLNKDEYEILFKLSLKKNNNDIIELLKKDDKVKDITNILKHLMKTNLSLFKTFSNLNDYLDDNGFNLLEVAIIDKNIEAIMFLKDLKFNRSSYYVEVSYNTNYITYSDEPLLTKENIPKHITNCKMLNALLIDEMLNHGIFDETYDYIIHHFKYFDYSLLCDMLVRNYSIVTVKLLLKNNKLEFNKHTVNMLVKMKLEDFTIKEQKEIFLNNTEEILKIMMNDEKVWKNFKEKKYLNLLNHNFIINKDYDNILHLLIKCEYKDFHDEILQYVYDINKEVINNVNSNNENCIFEMTNKKIINKIFVYGVNNIQNIYGDYFIHKLIRNNNFNLIFSTLSISSQMLNLKNTYDETPIILAAKLKYDKIVNYFNKMKCDMNCYDKFGNSVYHYISLNNLKVNFKMNMDVINKYNEKSISYLINHIITEY